MSGPVSTNLLRSIKLRLHGTSSLKSFRGRGTAALLGVLLTLILLGCSEKEAREAPKPPDVEVAEVITQNVPVFHEAVAQLNGPVNADITPKVQGYLLTQNYTNGAFVQKGQLLFEIDPRPFQAALEQAKADVERALAGLEKANNDVERDTPLAAQRAIPQKQLDDDKAAQAWSTAQVAASKAQQQQSELNLGWTNVHSPVNGIAGVANSQIGDLVGTSTKMTVVSQIDPIWAYFNVSESFYLGFASQIRKVLEMQKAKSPVPVEYIQANDVPYPFKGNLIFINREIAAGTGTIQMAAAFPNRDAILRPGGFGRVRVQIGNTKNAMLVPQAAVIEVQSQYQLIVVSPDNKATIRPVKVGDRVGSKWIITEGVNPGDKVVVEGIQKVQTFAAQSPQSAKEGIPVTPKPYVAELDGSS